MGVVIFFWLVMISQAIWMLKPGLMKLTSKKTGIFFVFSYEISILVVNLCAPSLSESESYCIIVLVAHGNFFVRSFAKRVLLSEHDNRSGKK